MHEGYLLDVGVSKVSKTRKVSGLVEFYNLVGEREITNR